METKNNLRQQHDFRCIKFSSFKTSMLQFLRKTKFSNLPLEFCKSMQKLWSTSKKTSSPSFPTTSCRDGLLTNVSGDRGGITPIGWDTYQAFYGLKHYNLLETISFLIKKLNQPTSCLMLQFKGKIHLNFHLIAVSSKKIMCLVH